MKTKSKTTKADNRTAADWTFSTFSIQRKLAEKGIEWRTSPGNGFVGYPGHYIAWMHIVDGKLRVKMGDDFHTSVYDLATEADEINLAIGTILCRKNDADSRRACQDDTRRRLSEPLEGPDFLREVQRLMDRLVPEWKVKLEFCAYDTVQSKG